MLQGVELMNRANIITGFQKESDMIMQKLEEYNNVNKSVSRDNEKLRNDMKKRDEIFKEKDKLFNEYKETVDKRIVCEFEMRKEELSCSFVCRFIRNVNNYE